LTIFDNVRRAPHSAFHNVQWRDHQNLPPAPLQLVEVSIWNSSGGRIKKRYFLSTCCTQIRY
jgi:hypothetical protein